MFLNPSEVSGFQQENAHYQGNGIGTEMYVVPLGRNLRETERQEWT